MYEHNLKGRLLIEKIKKKAAPTGCWMTYLAFPKIVHAVLPHFIFARCERLCNRPSKRPRVISPSVADAKIMLVAPALNGHRSSDFFQIAGTIT